MLRSCLFLFEEEEEEVGKLVGLDFLKFELRLGFLIEEEMEVDEFGLLISLDLIP